MSQTAVPLAIDLDGTLIKTDLVVESLLLAIKRNLLLVLLIPIWLMRGRAVLKRELAQRVRLDPTNLPYRQDVIDHIKACREAGAETLLVTGSDQLLAEPVAAHLGLFDRVLASDGELSLTRAAKRDALVESFGEGGYDYIGNATADRLPWLSARQRLVVATPVAAGKLANGFEFDRLFEVESTSVALWFRTLRAYQWIKNVLLFVPLILAHDYNSPDLLWATLLAFATFSLCSSAVYVINDLMDLPHDRAHPRKSRRPFASGDLSIFHGLWLAPALLLIVALLLSRQPVAFAQVTFLYFVLTCGYSLVLKRIVIVDVLVLAGLYTLRIIAGAAVVGHELSFWLLAFSMFLFMSLALLKRFAEVNERRGGAVSDAVAGRGYSAGDANYLATLGAASGFSAVVVMALYINSDIVGQLYSSREILWFVCPVLLFWISRMWFAAHRGIMRDDPIVFAIRDSASLISAAMIASSFVLAT